MAEKKTFRNANIIWRNFRGEASMYNANGNRSFAILIKDPDVAQELIDEGYSLKVLKKKDINDDDAWALKVKVRFDVRPPKVKMVTYPNGRMKTTDLNEDTISALDWAEAQKIDLTVSPYEWVLPNGNSGITAYLEVMYFTPVEDALEAEYTEHLDEDEAPF